MALRKGLASAVPERERAYRKGFLFSSKGFPL